MDRVDRMPVLVDYPHWDFDDPRFCVQDALTEPSAPRSSTQRRALYKL